MNSVEKYRDDAKYHWTLHGKHKAMQYGLSPNIIKRVIRFPDRKEEGIAKDTVAVMRQKGKKKENGEIWVMYQKRVVRGLVQTGQAASGDSGINERKKLLDMGKFVIISAWIYPGVSPKGKEIFIPDDVWEEISG
jgi:hypothetical protein